MTFSNMKVLLFVSLLVAGVMKAECQEKEQQGQQGQEGKQEEQGKQEDVNSDRIKSLARLALAELDKASGIGIAREITVIKAATTRYDPVEITTLSMEVCPASALASTECELCQVQLSRTNQTSSYQLDAAHSSCHPIATSKDSGGGGVAVTQPAKTTSGSTITHCGVFYVFPIVVLSQIHKILSLF